MMVYKASGLFWLDSCNQHFHSDQETENQTILCSFFSLIYILGGYVI